jgi:hypothetical protein
VGTEWRRHKAKAVWFIGRLPGKTFGASSRMPLAASTPVFPANIWPTGLQPANVAMIRNREHARTGLITRRRDLYMRPVQIQSWICGAQHDPGTSHQSLERGER